MWSAVVLWALLAILHMSVTPTTSNSPLYLAISAKRNTSGYWIAQVDMDHSAGVDWDVMETFGVTMNVDIKPCRNGEIFHFTFDVKAPTLPALRNHFPQFKLSPELDTAFSWSDWIVGSWQEASQTCRRERSHLAVVTTMQAAANLASQLPAEATAYVGIRYDNGSSVDQFGSPLDVDPWLLQPPRHNEKERCYALDRSMLMFPMPCTIKMNFFCERSFA